MDPDRPVPMDVDNPLSQPLLVTLPLSTGSTAAPLVLPSVVSPPLSLTSSVADTSGPPSPMPGASPFPDEQYVFPPRQPQFTPDPSTQAVGLASSEQLHRALSTSFDTQGAIAGVGGLAASGSASGTGALSPVIAARLQEFLLASAHGTNTPDGTHARHTPVPSSVPLSLSLAQVTPEMLASVRTPLTDSVLRLQQHIQSLFRNARRDGPDGFSEEFSFIEKESEQDNFFGDKSSSRKPFNKTKNRYSNVLAYEHTRVVLPHTGAPGSDYINANFISGDCPNSSQAYIATQGPIENTIHDFWRMVWLVQTNMIVMLTRLVEGPPGNERSKCSRYYPSRSSPVKVSGHFRITLVSKELSAAPPDPFAAFPLSASASSASSAAAAAAAATTSTASTTATASSSPSPSLSSVPTPPSSLGDGVASPPPSLFVVRLLLIENTREGIARYVWHFQYREWPDHSLPASTATFRHLLHRVDAIVGHSYDVRPPVVVHCSAGIGRTGTFATVHSALRSLRFYQITNPDCLNAPLDITRIVLDAVLRLRKQRFGMVQTKDQYVFCYVCLLEALQEEEQELRLLLLRGRTVPQAIGEMLYLKCVRPDLPPLPAVAIAGPDSNQVTSSPSSSSTVLEILTPSPLENYSSATLSPHDGVQQSQQLSQPQQQQQQQPDDLLRRGSSTTDGELFSPPTPPDDEWTPANSSLSSHL